jgi:hypothetical protein
MWWVEGTKRRKPRSIGVAKIAEVGRIRVESEQLAHHLRHKHFSIVQSRVLFTLPQPLPTGHCGTLLIFGPGRNYFAHEIS